MHNKIYCGDQIKRSTGEFKMNAYSQTDLCAAFDEILLQLGFVTSLDVKLNLRNKNFYAVQSEISNEVNFLALSRNMIVDYKQNQNGSVYRVYTNNQSSSNQSSPIVNNSNNSIGADGVTVGADLNDDIRNSVNALLT